MAIGRHMTYFAGREVIKVASGQAPTRVRGVALWIAEAYKSTRFADALEAVLSAPDAADIEALVIGPWSDALYDRSSADAAQLLIHASARLPKLEALFIGDITYEESEISWINQSDLGPLVRAFPHLKVFGARGGNGLRLSNLQHDTLEELVLQAGGLPAAAVRNVTDAVLPALHTLELWLGTEDYGGDSSVADLAPLLSGKLFPRLNVLRLRNCAYADALAMALAAAPIYQQLSVLDLSLGTLRDQSVPALLQNPGERLQILDLSENYLSPEQEEELQGALPGVEIRTFPSKYEEWEREEEEEEEGGYITRYVTHAE